MSKTPLARVVALATLGASLTLPSLAQADFIGDSKATLELRNFYMNATCATRRLPSSPNARIGRRASFSRPSPASPRAPLVLAWTPMLAWA